MDVSTTIASAADDQAVHCRTCYKELLEAIASVKSAFIVICLRTDTTLLMSESMRSLLTLQPGSIHWRSDMANDSELVAACERAIVSSETDWVAEIEVAKSKRSVHFTKYQNGQLVVTVHAEPSVAENLHEYMQARDNLFSTSRTISVSEMATTLAHELNTPIGTISNILNGVKMRLKNPDAQIGTIDSALDRALDQTRFSQNIISRIRDFTQSRRPKPDVLDTRLQLKEAIELLDWLLKHNHCQVQIIVPDEPLYISGDATMLQQVFINLIRNAVDAMYQQNKERRKLKVSAENIEGKITVSITDTGHGLGSGDKLFVPFATTKSGGMGVGLNICRSFIELHQGRLWLSPNEQEGCTCFVELPEASQDAIQKKGFV